MLRQNPRGLPLGFRLPILPPAFGQLLRQRQRLFHRGGAELLGLGVQVGIDVGRGGNIAVAQPGLDLLHLDAAAQQKAGAAVPRIVKSDLAQPVFAQKLGKCRGNVVRVDQLADLVDIDIADVILHINVILNRITVPCEGDGIDLGLLVGEPGQHIIREEHIAADACGVFLLPGPLRAGHIHPILQQRKEEEPRE